jgi:hypothetical protein
MEETMEAKLEEIMEAKPKENLGATYGAKK